MRRILHTINVWIKNVVTAVMSLLGIASPWQYVVSMSPICGGTDGRFSLAIWLNKEIIDSANLADGKYHHVFLNHEDDSFSLYIDGKFHRHFKVKK